MSDKNNGKKYNDEFKKQIVLLVNNGKEAKSIAKEYNIARTTICKWVLNYNSSGSLKLNDNRGGLEKEIINLRKELKQAKMENDILKQAALIMAKK